MTKNFIQDITKDIDKRGTEGVCTGPKFGSPSCPPDSKRFNLAKLFHRFASEKIKRSEKKNNL